ncbi:hypothetical protein [Algoriphagus sp. A40]|uniref:hypothetical protein n=1 Tax=Algoriphagus sp. A40 TaxID=1945863 RepID=UPI000987D276|nr:hypothetical protein [Algoriphagus sp. A40]OOG79001.1 hypothetical protein B0E43_00135 [Algoriphagus sp. A40]
MKKYLILILVSFLFWSCAEDVNKEINTDLTQEAAQFFQFTEAIGESSYLGNIPFVDYSRITSAELPGCPSITISPNSRIIELIYGTSSECIQQNISPRTGKIVLDFTLSNTTLPTWSLTYENYSVDGIQIEGVRHFTGLSLNENQETFENLTVELNKSLSFTINGTFSYSTSRSSLKPFALSTRGKMEGRNPAGRNFSLVITEAKEQLFQCYREGWTLPQSGKESWIVSRGNSSDLEYKVNFQGTEDCNSMVVSTMPDGRTLQLNP